MARSTARFPGKLPKTFSATNRPGVSDGAEPLIAVARRVSQSSNERQKDIGLAAGKAADKNRFPRGSGSARVSVSRGDVSGRTKSLSSAVSDRKLSMHTTVALLEERSIGRRSEASVKAGLD